MNTFISRSLIFLTLLSLSMFLSVTVQATNQPVTPLQNLAQLQWQKRILIIWTDQPQALLASLIEGYDTEISERSLLVLVSDHDLALYSNYAGDISPALAQQLLREYPPAKAHYFLVGKDGDTKMAADQLSITEVLQRIDQMPMRQLEIRRSQAEH